MLLTDPSGAPILCDCGARKLLAVSPGDEDVPARAWCATCWAARFAEREAA